MPSTRRIEIVDDVSGIDVGEERRRIFPVLMYLLKKSPVKMSSSLSRNRAYCGFLPERFLERMSGLGEEEEGVKRDSV